MQTYFCLLVRKLVFLNNKECGTFFCLYIIQLLCFYRFFPKEVFWRILLVVMPATDELTSYTYIHVNLEWNCSFCVALGCTTNWTARGLTFFDDLGFSFSEMHSCLYWYACIFAYICKRFCIPCPIRRCLLPPVFDGNVASIFSLTSSILVDICWRFAPIFETRKKSISPRHLCGVDNLTPQPMKQSILSLELFKTCQITPKAQFWKIIVNHRKIIK